jgi:RimJ/RimL family protein N-acetyltransferase
MEHFPDALSRDESDRMMEGMEEHFQAHGFGEWALELKGTGAFIGFAGLAWVGFESSFTPAVELAWRLAPAHWGQGYATEAAKAAIEAAFGVLGMKEVVAFTVPANHRSIAVMQRLGMQADGTFEHPRLPEGHRLRPHALYRLQSPRSSR